MMPAMKVTFVALLALGTTVNAQMPSLTAAEKSAGWKLLFDGKSLNGWRGYQTATAPTGWRAENGAPRTASCLAWARAEI